MIDWTNILTHSASVGAGGVAVYYILKLNDYLKEIDYLNNRLDDIEKSTLTPEEMALKLLSVKMPIKDLPPEVVEQFRQEAEKAGKKMPEAPDYMG